MIGILASLALAWSGAEQEPAKAPWRTDVRAARETALKERRPCVLFLYVDSK